MKKLISLFTVLLFILSGCLWFSTDTYADETKSSDSETAASETVPETQASPVILPTDKVSTDDIILYSSAACVIDVDSGEILYYKNMAINQLKAGAFLSYISIILNNIIGLLYMPFMLRMMGQNEYGLYSLVASVVAYLTVLDLGFANAIVRYTAKFRSEHKINEQYEMFGMFFILYC